MAMRSVLFYSSSQFTITMKFVNQSSIRQPAEPSPTPSNTSPPPVDPAAAITRSASVLLQSPNPPTEGEAIARRDVTMEAEKLLEMGSESYGEAEWRLEVIEDDDAPIPPEHFPWQKK